MKTIIFLLLTSITFGQNMRLMIDDGIYDNPETLLYANSLSTALSDTQMVNIDTFISMVKDSLSISALTDKFDVIYLMANETSEAGLKNLVKRSHDAEVGAETVTFTEKQGFQSDGSTGYITTNYNANTEADKFQIESANCDASIGIYSRTNATGSFMFGAAPAPNYLIMMGRHATNIMQGYFCSNSAFTVANSNSSGLLAMASYGEKVNQYFGFYRNGVQLSGENAIATGISNYDIYICGYNNGDTLAGATAYQFSFFFIAGEITEAQMAKFNNCVEWYMDEMGTGVQ